jgi:hypothetical protein
MDFLLHFFGLLAVTIAYLPRRSEYCPKFRFSCRASQNSIRSFGFSAAHFKIMPEVSSFINRGLFIKSDFPDLTNEGSFIKSDSPDLANKGSFIKYGVSDLMNQSINAFSEISAIIFKWINMFYEIPYLLNNNALSIS